MIKKILIILIVFILILLPLFTILLLNHLIFSYLYDKLDLKDYNNIEKKDYLNKVSQIVWYFFNNKPFLEMQELSYIEKIHMKDVKTLICFALFVFILSIMGILIFKKQVDKLIMKQASFIALAIVALILTFSLTNFDSAFIIFHKILFRNSFWLLDPSTLLIRLFPESVFMNLAYVWFVSITILSILIIFLVSM
ncbi:MULTISPECIES: DUF1461 domain-containing protein [Caldisericum]|jgi:integral membrane protein (TIGR01906 family)|uniref:lipoprotein intramolecular transacylase Lit n=1 Tax=Caldisericum TaxID=693074 RepID=UPI0039FBBB02